MNDSEASRTALTAALMRAIHTRCDRPQLIDDPWGDTLVSPAGKAALYRRILDGADPQARRRLMALPSEQAVLDQVLRAHPTYGGVIVRSRYAEDALEAAVRGGVRQYVLVGAGFDSFILRQPPFARDIEVFEIDHPASQSMKRRRLDESGVALPANVRFVAADLRQESLAAVLARCGLSRIVPAFFSWLGVTIYLSRATNVATLAAIANSSAPRSEVVFTYVDQRVFQTAGSIVVEKMRASRATDGESWLSGFDPTTLPDELRAIGLELVEDLGGDQLAVRYCTGRTDGLRPATRGHIALARVGP